MPGGPWGGGGGEEEEEWIQRRGKDVGGRRMEEGRKGRRGNGKKDDLDFGC